MTLNLWHQENKRYQPKPTKEPHIRFWAFLLCTSNNSGFWLRNWRLQGLQIHRASRLWNEKWGYRLNVSSADCYSPEKRSLGQSDKYCYLNLPLLLWKHRRLLWLWHIPADWRFFSFTFFFSPIYGTPRYVVLATKVRGKRGKAVR